MNKKSHINTEKLLKQAILANQTKEVELLLKRHPEAARRRDEEGLTLLMLAAKEGRAGSLRALMPLSLMNAADELGAGYNALMYAIEAGHEDCAALLVPKTKLYTQSLYATERSIPSLEMAEKKGMSALVGLIQKTLKNNVIEDLKPRKRQP